MKKYLSKKEFMNEIEGSLCDVEDRQDCMDWWDCHICAYVEDKIIGESAYRWVNSFLKYFE